MDAEYLKKNIEIPIRKGLFETATKQPNDPIQFLGNYLVTYTQWEQEKGDRAIAQKKYEEAIASIQLERVKRREEEARAEAAKAEAEAQSKRKAESEAAAAAAAVEEAALKEKQKQEEEANENAAIAGNPASNEEAPPVEEPPKEVVEPST